jgi:hypothetical protein
VSQSVPEASAVRPTPSHRVDRTTKEDRLNGGWHRHATALCLDDGRRISKEEAIADIRAGRVAYYLLAGGSLADVGVADRCPRCGEPYLTTSRDSSFLQPLVRLPDC